MRQYQTPKKGGRTDRLDDGLVAGGRKDYHSPTGIEHQIIGHTILP